MKRRKRGPYEDSPSAKTSRARSGRSAKKARRNSGQHSANTQKQPTSRQPLLARYVECVDDDYTSSAFVARFLGPHSRSNQGSYTGVGATDGRGRADLIVHSDIQNHAVQLARVQELTTQDWLYYQSCARNFIQSDTREGEISKIGTAHPARVAAMGVGKNNTRK